MNVWNDCNPVLGRGIKRVVRQCRRQAPPGIRFVAERCDAELVIDHAVDADVMDWPVAEGARRVVWQYTHKTSPEQDWPRLWNAVDMVASYLELPTPKLYRTTLGVDPTLFYPEPETAKRYGILATGYVAETEFIREAYEACLLLDLDFCHLGPDFGWGSHYCRFEDVSEAAMRGLYNGSYLALGARQVEGFELPALEAAACGTTALRLRLPCYDWWARPYDNLCWRALSPRAMGNPRRLAALIAQERARFAHDGRRRAQRSAAVARDFAWEAVMGRFWREVLDDDRA